MPNTKTAWKNMRKNARKAAINKPRRTQIKNYIKNSLVTIKEMAKSGVDSNSVITAIRSNIGKIHSLSRKNVFDKLRARRIESRMVQKIKRMCAGSTAE